MLGTYSEDVAGELDRAPQDLLAHWHGYGRGSPFDGSVASPILTDD
jgi:hypothetical protein